MPRRQLPTKEKSCKSRLPLCNSLPLIPPRFAFSFLRLSLALSLLLEPCLEAVQPIQVLCLADKKTELDLVQKLHFHHVDLLDADSRHLRPCLVRKGVIIQKLVRQHQRHCKQPELGSLLSMDRRVVLEEFLDVFERKQDHRRRQLSSREDLQYIVKADM